jgi:hypothetical protein
MATPRIAESGSRQLPDSSSWELATPHTVESGSRRLSDLSSFLLNIQKPTCQVGESFFDYEYLHEFEAKIGMARKVV